MRVGSGTLRSEGKCENHHNTGCSHPSRVFRVKDGTSTKPGLLHRTHRAIVLPGLRANFLVALFVAALPSPDSSRYASTIVFSSPGKRLSISSHREILCISTPCRSLRISPLSRRILKCCERVDFGIALSLTVRKVEQFCGQSCPTMSTKIATRTESESA